MRYFTSSKSLKALILLEVVLIITLAIFAIYRVTQNPLEPTKPLEAAPIQSPTHTKTVPSQEQPDPTPTLTLLPADTITLPTRTPLPSITPNISTLCGGPPNMLILALGIDNRWDSYYYGLADVIRIARIDYTNGEVTVLTLPRDLWVQIPGLEEREITHGKLNQAYFYGSEYLGYYSGPDLGPGLMIETLDLNYDLEISKYITLNMISFEKMIDVAGGIDIYLPWDVDGVSEDPPVDLGYFEKGYHHFTGEAALRFARIRMIDNDLQRSNRQSMILEAFWKKLMSPSILPRIPELVKVMLDSVETNLKVKDIQQMVCLAPLIADQEINFVSLPPSMLEEDRIFVERYMKTVFYWKVDRDELVQLLGDFQAGLWPPEP